MPGFGLRYKMSLSLTLVVVSHSHTATEQHCSQLSTFSRHSVPLHWQEASFPTRPRGVARIGPKGSAHLEFEHFTRTTPKGKGENLGFGHFTRTTPEPRGCLSPLSTPPPATALGPLPIIPFSQAKSRTHRPPVPLVYFTVDTSESPVVLTLYVAVDSIPRDLQGCGAPNPGPLHACQQQKDDIHNGMTSLQHTGSVICNNVASWRLVNRNTME